MTDDELEIGCAVRYALGRRTYIVPFMCKRVKMHVENGALTKRAMNQIITEIDREEQMNCLGSQCDKDAWLDLRSWLRKRVE